MFEQYKLNKYSEYIVGFAYDVIVKDGINVIIKTYLVIKKNGKYSFIYLNKSDKILSLDVECRLNKLENIGYKPLLYYIEEKKEKDKTFAKGKFKRIK